MGFEEELQTKVDGAKQRILVIANEKGSRTREYITKAIRKLSSDLAIKYKEEGNPEDTETIKSSTKKITKALLLEFRQKKNTAELDPETNEQGRVVDSEIIEVVGERAIDISLKRVFNKIKIDGNNITKEVLDKPFTEKDITVDNPYRGSIPRYSSEKVRKRIQADDETILEKVMPLVEKVFLGIDYYYTNKAVDTEVVVIDVRDDILDFMGESQYSSTARRKAIYKEWKKVATKHMAVYEAVEELISELPEIYKDEKITLEQSNKLFRDEGQYVLKFKGVIVSRVLADSAVVPLIEGVLHKDMKLATADERDSDRIGIDGNTNYYEIEEEEEEDAIEIVEEMRLTYGFNEEMDPLGVNYLETYANGILVGESEINKLRELAGAMGVVYGFENTNEIRLLEKAIARIADIVPVSGEYYLPVQVLKNKGTASKISPEDTENSTSVDTITNRISNLLEELEELIMDTKMSAGGSFTASRGKVTNPKDKSKTGMFQSENYGASYPASTGRAKEFETNVQSKIDAVIKSLDDYLYEPLQNPNMTLDFDFKIKRKSAYKNIQLQGKSDFVKAYRKMLQRANTKKGSLFKAGDLKDLESLLKSLNKPEIRSNEVLKAAENLLPTIKRAFGRDRAIISQYKKEVAKLIHSINLRFGKPTGQLDFLGEKIPQTGEAPVPKKEKDSISGDSLTVVALFKEFFLDEGNKNLISRKASAKAKSIVNQLSELRKSEVEDKIMEIHDSIRILKGLPVYYGRGSLSSIEDMGTIINSSRDKFNIDLTSTDIVKIIEEVDAFYEISKSVGLPQEVVYYVKANFR
tara:strand:+ start:3098 stop:5524 length:2427 start_codon:yes stop_codon:yes gene_type:complete